MLSYAAKRGIGIPERLQLGHHTSNFQMGMVYSKDGAAASIYSFLTSSLMKLRRAILILMRLVVVES